MNVAANQLPAGFEALENFLEDWAIEGANNRLQKRIRSNEKDRVAFFEVASKLAPEALEMLDKKPLGELDAKEKTLMNLMLSLAHMSLAVEVQRDQESMHAEFATHITITRATSDENPST